MAYKRKTMTMDEAVDYMNEHPNSAFRGDNRKFKIGDKVSCSRHTLYDAKTMELVHEHMYDGTCATHNYYAALNFGNFVYIIDGDESFYPNCWDKGMARLDLEEIIIKNAFVVSKIYGEYCKDAAGNDVRCGSIR